MATGNWIEHEDGALKPGEAAMAQVCRWYISPTEANEEGLSVTNTSPVAQHIFDVSRGQVSLREALRSMYGNGFQLTFGHRRVLTQ
jgi:hypothetical protein